MDGRRARMVVCGLMLGASAGVLRAPAQELKGSGERTEILPVQHAPVRESSDVIGALRGALEPGGAKVTLLPSQNAVLVRGSAEQIAAAQRLLVMLDKNGDVTESLPVRYATDQRGENEVLTAIRNTLDPNVKIYLVPSQSVIIVHGSPGQVEEAKRLLAMLDRSRRSYRLTYTVTDTDAGKRIGVQHFAVVVTEGERTTMKQGSQVPIMTGANSHDKNDTAITYSDIGFNVDASIDEVPGGVRLRTRVERSSVSEETVAGFGSQDPIIRRTVVEGTSTVEEGKPLVVGGSDVVGSTRHVDVEVVVEPVR